MRAKEFDYQLKLVIVGQSAVGKSALLLRFADNTFNESYFNTIGVDFRFKTLLVDGKNIKLQIWDTAGQEKFRTITNTYYKNADAVLLVYDVTSKESFDEIKRFWINEVDSYADPGTKLFLIGNKVDLSSDRQVSADQALAFAKERSIGVFQTSAKTAAQVAETFEEITRTLYRELEGEGVKTKEEKRHKEQLKLQDNKAGPERRGCGC